MKTALLEIRGSARDDISSSYSTDFCGSAFPATLAFQIRELERETSGDLKLDAIVTVIDAENFMGYEDTSPTARMQSSYTDMLLINKWEHVSDRQLDLVLDHLNTLNDQTPKIRCQGRNGVDPNLIFGLDSPLFLDGQPYGDATHNDEVETVTLYRDVAPPHLHTEGSCHHCSGADEAASKEAEPVSLDENLLDSVLAGLPKETIWRVKGFIQLGSRPFILNWAFGRYDLTPIDSGDKLRLTVMGERGEVKRAAKKLASGLGGRITGTN